MKLSILKFRYISVRDDWTQMMIKYLTDEEVVPDITPDPVFAFNFNASHLVPPKEEILSKYSVPKDYIILSFKGQKSVNQAWIDKFQTLANEHGLACVKLPYADAQAFGNIQYSVGETLTPLEWYALIKYSKGYIGNNMHPIVTAITNGVPFFSFDNYGIPIIDGKRTKGESSKIYHILKQADLLDNRVYTLGQDYLPIEPDDTLNAILSFDNKKSSAFAKNYYQKYEQMMVQVFNKIQK